jgi:hypothetical protein
VVTHDSTAKTAANGKKPSFAEKGPDSLRGIQEKSSSSGQELVSVNAGRDASAAIVRFNPDDFSEASDVNVSSQGDLAGQGENELDGRSRLKISVYQKVETAETDVPRLSLPFASIGSA